MLQPEAIFVQFDLQSDLVTIMCLSERGQS